MLCLFHIAFFKNVHSKNCDITAIISCKSLCQNIKKSTCLKWTYGILDLGYRVKESSCRVLNKLDNSNIFKITNQKS